MDDMRAVFILVGFLAIVGIFIHGWRSSARTNNKTQHRQTSAAPAARTTPVSKGRGKEAVATARKPQQVEPRMSTSAQVARTRIERQEPTLGHARAEHSEPAVGYAASGSQGYDDPHEEAVVAFEPNSALSSEPSYQVDAAVEAPAAEKTVSADPDDILVLHVVSKGQPIEGPDLLHNLMTIGLRFGEMDIFHMYKSSSGSGPVMFSLVNMMNPGTFNIDEMEQFTTEGVALFMTLPCDGDARVHFSRMQGVAKGLADMHNAEVQDEHRQPWSDLKADGYLARIDKFERSA